MVFGLIFENGTSKAVAVYSVGMRDFNIYNIYLSIYFSTKLYMVTLTSMTETLLTF